MLSSSTTPQMAVIIILIIIILGGSDSKESACSVRELGLIPGREDPVENPLQYSCLENSTDRGAWRATIHGVTKSQDVTEQLSTHRHIPMNSILSKSKVKNS